MHTERCGALTSERLHEAHLGRGYIEAPLDYFGRKLVEDSTESLGGLLCGRLLLSIS